MKVKSGFKVDDLVKYAVPNSTEKLTARVVTVHTASTALLTEYEILITRNGRAYLRGATFRTTGNFLTRIGHRKPKQLTVKESEQLELQRRARRQERKADNTSVLISAYNR